MSNWFEDWGWIVWISVGAICFWICQAMEGDDGLRPMAVVGACGLGPLMIIPLGVMTWRRHSTDTQGGK